MQKIRALLLVRDTSFFFNIYYPDLPFKKEILIPEGNLTACLAVPTSDDFKLELKSEASGHLGDLGRLWIEGAEKGLDGNYDLLIECPVLVILEQEVESEIIRKYKDWRDYTNKLIEAEYEKVAERIDIEEMERRTSPTYHNEMLKICRKYLKRFLLSLREKGNICRLRFHDNNQPGYEFVSGLFGRYYFNFELQDEGGDLLFNMSPLPILMKESKPKNNFKVAKRVPSEELQRSEENLINMTSWQHICTDLASEFEPDLAKTILLDAQDEALSGNINMSVVCTAIACEILTDRFILTEAKRIGNQLYEYIIDKEFRIPVIDMLDVPLKSLVGFSIKDKHRDLWNDLQKLYEARNKVAHEGKCYYMSNSGKTQILVDPKKTMHFIERAYELFAILGK